MGEFLQRVEGEIQGRRLLARGQKILVAVSGGVDSMALLYVLNLLAKTHRWKISVAHFNHRLRGRSSDADERLVRRTAAKLRLEFFGGGADVKKAAAQLKISVEMAARKLRHEFLAEVSREQKMAAVALAHHADDQVELFFLRLLRGAGGEGLAGMKWCSPSPVDSKLTLVRPLLGFAKMEIVAFARKCGIRFRDDATNFSNDYLRNRIRNELLPLLKRKYQPGLDKAVLRLMEIAGAETEFVGEVARSRVPAKAGFDRLPGAVQRRILQMRLAELGIDAAFELVERLREAPGKFASVKPGLYVARDAAGRISRREDLEKKFNPEELRLKLQGKAGEIEFGGRNFRWQIQALKKFVSPKAQAGLEVFDADKVGDEITLRHWHAGDRFQPIGMPASAKLQNLFVNAKIPAARRRKLVLAAMTAGEILWVEGLRISEGFKLTPKTKRRLVWHWRRDPF